MITGIYGIRNKINGKIYVGSTKDFKQRKRKHLSLLRLKKHHNKHLQNSFNKYGEKTFIWIMLEKVHKLEILHIQEKVWIIKLNTTNPANGYNINEEPNAMQGRHHTEQTKKLLSEQRIGQNKGANNPNYGKKQPLSVRLQMATNNSNTKLNKKNILIIVRLLKEKVPHENIAKKFNVSRTVITRISNGTRWKNITGGPIFPVIYQDGIRQFSEDHRNKIGNSHKGMKYKIKNKIKEKV
jgi:group I intron endonuclease